MQTSQMPSQNESMYVGSFIQIRYYGKVLNKIGGVVLKEGRQFGKWGGGKFRERKIKKSQIPSKNESM